MKQHFSLTNSFNFKNRSIEELYKNAYDWLLERSPEKNEIWRKYQNYIIDDAKQYEYINFRIIDNKTGYRGDYSRTASIKFEENESSVTIIIDIPLPLADDGPRISYPSFLHDRMYEIFKAISGEVLSSDLSHIYPEVIIKKVIFENILTMSILLIVISIICIGGFSLQKDAGNLIGGIMFLFGLIVASIFLLHGAYKSYSKYRAIRKIIKTIKCTTNSCILLF